MRASASAILAASLLLLLVLGVSFQRGSHEVSSGPAWSIASASVEAAIQPTPAAVVRAALTASDNAIGHGKSGITPHANVACPSRRWEIQEFGTPNRVRPHACDTAPYSARAPPSN